jgi:hypothetical protein
VVLVFCQWDPWVGQVKVPVLLKQGELLLGGDSEEGKLRVLLGLF